NALNICLDVNGKIKLNPAHNIETIKVDSIKEAKKNSELTSIFPLLKDELIEAKDSLDLIVNVTNDINEKTEKENRRFAKIFSPKRIIITNILIVLCLIAFSLMYVLGNGSQNSLTLLQFGANYSSLIQQGQVWRLLTSAFLHIGIIHLLVNMYSLYIIGSQVETFMGKWKYLAIYLISAISGNLLSVACNTDVLSAGASGAIFGLMGSLLYFGYHYRLYLNDALRRQIIPILLLNLLIGFTFPGIDNAAHIGGLIGGYLTTMAIGIEGKSSQKNQINGWIVLLLYIIFLSVVIFVLK
ncbi:MAG: rhomboid family intramembrane serine protease, partial [Bacilli bacterium]|nr:rhomboid family intramembrane serine protease [Bacilli bacterium]